jgi:hypothetical protein
MPRDFTPLIEALTILNEYAKDDRWRGTHCEHDMLTVCGVDPDEVSDEHKEALERLGFFVGDEYGESAFHSYRWGSC